MLNNFLTKLWYKIFNKGKYIDLKNEKRTFDRVKYYNSRIYAQILEIQKSRAVPLFQVCGAAHL